MKSNANRPFRTLRYAAAVRRSCVLLALAASLAGASSAPAIAQPAPPCALESSVVGPAPHDSSPGCQAGAGPASISSVASAPAAELAPDTGSTVAPAPAQPAIAAAGDESQASAPSQAQAVPTARALAGAAVDAAAAQLANSVQPVAGAGAQAAPAAIAAVSPTQPAINPISPPTAESAVAAVVVESKPAQAEEQHQEASRDDVLKALGTPQRRESRGLIEAWHYCRTGRLVDQFMAVVFRDGKVIGTKRYRVTSEEAGDTGECAKFARTVLQ